MSSAGIELTVDERRETLPKVATNKWHSALSMFPGVWVPQMAAFPVSDSKRPNEKFGVVLYLDYHHDSALSRVFYSDQSEALRAEFRATPQIEADRVRLKLPTDEKAQILLADKIIRALVTDNQTAHSDAEPSK